MKRARIVARLDVKGPNLIKGIQMEGLRVLGAPNDFARRYYAAGIDELLYIDCVASLYGRNNLHEIVERAAEDIFVPITVGGGIRSVADARTLLRAGADKVAVNTAAVADPDLVSRLAEAFGSQCIVLSVQAKSVGELRWEVYTDAGRERSGRDVVEWVRQGVENGAGEVLLTSVDREGTRSGFDLELLRTAGEGIPVPVVASGGMGEPAHAIQAVTEGGVDAVAMADVLHYERFEVGDIRKALRGAGIEVRRVR